MAGTRQYHIDGSTQSFIPVSTAEAIQDLDVRHALEPPHYLQILSIRVLTTDFILSHLIYKISLATVM